MAEEERLSEVQRVGRWARKFMRDQERTLSDNNQLMRRRSAWHITGRNTPQSRLVGLLMVTVTLMATVTAFGAGPVAAASWRTPLRPHR